MEGGVWCLLQLQQHCSQSVAADVGSTKVEGIAVRHVLVVSGCPESEPGQDKIALLASAHRASICVLRGAFLKGPSGLSPSPMVLVNHVSCSWNSQFFIYLLFVLAAQCHQNT